MSIILGGAFAAGAFANGMRSEVATTPSSSLSQWLQLRPDPLGRQYTALAATIAMNDYYAYPGLSKYRSETAGNYFLLGWNQSYTYHWRFVVPKDWVTLGVGTDVIVMQMHDVNAGAVGRRPTFAGSIKDSSIELVFSLDATPLGQTVYSTPCIAGQEYEFSIRARWADGTNAPDANGLIEIYNGDTLVTSFAGRNTWAGNASTEPNPPYIKAGVYQAGPGYGWWAGKSALMYYVAALCATGDETPASLRAQINQQLGVNSNAAKVVV